MKISIGSRIINGPWGGGNLFVINLTKYLENNGHIVIDNLSHSDIDLILLTDPRSRNESTSTFNHIDIANYKKYVNPNTVVVQRINECDERKETEGINRFYLEASHCADQVIFVSKWLESIYLNLGMRIDKTKVILSGSDPNIFWSNNNETIIPEKFRIVTHHWSSHINKGFKEYFFLDELLENKYWRDLIEFTYIGNLSENQQFKNVNVLEPLSGVELAKELRNHHIYVTGSVNEPSGNHHIEGALCGLPILYKNSGGIPEYCHGYGVSFEEDFEDKLKNIIENYEKYKKNINNYPFKSDVMCAEYLISFNALVTNRIKQREISKFNFKSLVFRMNHLMFDIYLFNLKDRLKNLIILIFKIIGFKKWI